MQGVLCWRLDRLGRNLRYLVLLLDECRSRGIAFVTLAEGIDTSAAAGRLVAGVLPSIAEFERARIQERIHLGLARARAQGKRVGGRRTVALPPGARSKITIQEAAGQRRVSRRRPTTQCDGFTDCQSSWQ